MKEIKLKIHGCRGSSSYDSLNNQIFGGNTSSYSIMTPTDELIFLDAGTGFQDAEKEFFENQPRETYLLLSHPHHDHIEGLGVSSLAFMEDIDLTIIGRRNLRKGLEARLNSDNFPINLEQMKAIKAIKKPKRKINNIRMKVLKGIHPGGVLGYRLNIENKTIVYATDMEFDYNPKGKRLSQRHKRKYRRFIKKADILIADAQFTSDEYLKNNPINVKGWGHSYAEQIIDLARKARVKKIIFTHHAPKRTDQELSEMEKTAQAYCQDIEISYARQGSEHFL